MIGEIIKILSIKESRNPGDYYLRVEFKLDDGRWAKTDLVPRFRNYRRWKELLRIGNIIANMKMLDKQTIDADSRVFMLSGRRVLKKKRFGVKELCRMGVFG